MADELSLARDRGPIGRERPARLNTASNRVKNHGRICQETINAWFELVQGTIENYGVCADDIHNFDETGFLMGAIGSMRIVTGSERRTRPDLTQSGNPEWVTVIQSICAAGYAIPPFIIYKGRVHISDRYKAEIPEDWKLSASKNGSTNDALNLKWLKHFDEQTAMYQSGLYRLLILDIPESHLSHGFKKYCRERNILTLCMPANLSHTLHPLDVVCFSLLKQKYSQRVQDSARHQIWHVNRERFLSAFRDAFFDVFTSENCKKAFEVAGLVPINARRLIDGLSVSLQTPLQASQPETPRQLKTSTNTYEFGSQPTLVGKRFTNSIDASPEGLSQFEGVKLANQVALQAAHIADLKKQLVEARKQKAQRRNCIQTGRTTKFSRGISRAAISAPAARTISNKSRSSGSQERTQPGRRCCGNCGELGHYARTCQKDT